MNYSKEENRNPGGCWACQHFHGKTAGDGAHAVCEKDPDRYIILGQAKDGCVYWKYDGRWKTRTPLQYPKLRQRG